MDPGPPRLARARRLAELGRHADAAELLSSHLGEHPDDADATCRLGLAQLNLGRPEEALETASAAVGLDPAGEWGHRLRAVALLRLRRVDDARAAVAEASLREALRLEPENAVALHNLGITLLRRSRRDEEGLECLATALRLDPTNSQLRASVQAQRDLGSWRGRPAWRSALLVLLFLAGAWLPLLVNALLRAARRARVRRELRRHLPPEAMRDLRDTARRERPAALLLLPAVIALILLPGTVADLVRGRSLALALLGVELVVLVSAGHPHGAVEADHLAVEHAVADDGLDQGAELVGASQARGEGHRCAERVADVRGAAASSGVSKVPGAMVSTLTPSRERSRASGRVMPTMPPLLAA